MNRYLITFSGRIWGSLGPTEEMTMEVEAESAAKAEMVLGDYFDRVHLVGVEEV